MVRSGINAVLLKWLRNDPDGKNTCSQFESDFSELASKFLYATADANRLVAAENLARRILHRNNLTKMAEIRREVRNLELMRTISYARQTDHSAHSVYLYLLGLWILYNSATVKEAFQKRFGHLNDFLFHWSYAGLLHDIGYVFSGPTSAIPSSRRILERFFQDARLTAILKPSNPLHADDFLKFMSFIRKTKSQAEWRDPCYSDTEYPDQIINELRKLPWLSRLNLDVDAFGLFHQNKFPKAVPVDGLEIYAYSVAETGYDAHSKGEVDHAIASSLFLLQWSSYFYWLAYKTKVACPKWYNRYFCRHDQIRESVYNYKLENFSNDIVPALYSSACHNILPTRSEGKCLLPIKLQDDPLAYLSILSDELQKWDRFPAGQKYTSNLEDFAAFSLLSENMGLQTDDKGIPYVTIREYPKVEETLRKNLNERLFDWSKIVLVRSVCSRKKIPRSRLSALIKSISKREKSPDPRIQQMDVRGKKKMKRKESADQ